ncbi:hypothetical protein [Neobacillus sp. SAB-20_R2A]|uniref:hypothetical protein n=1 Tax=Neobacillus sp. SAB-20_R2A TaxID=3120519 RepID=UPI003C6E4B73
MDSTSLGLTSQIRQQFTFNADDENLNTILRNISNRGVSFTAFTITKLKNNTNFVKIVVGPPESNSPEANRVVREVLRSQGVRFQEEKVIQLRSFQTGVPGVLARIYDALFRFVKVKAIYAGELNSIILNVSDVEKALQLLRQNNIIR